MQQTTRNWTKGFVTLEDSFGWVAYYLKALEPDRIKLALGALLAVFFKLKGLVGEAYLVFVSLVILDTFTGMLAARKKGEELSSARMSRGLIKIFIYSLVLLTGALMDIAVFGGLPDYGLYYITVGYCCAVEAKSVLENIEALGFDVPVFLFDILNRIKKGYGIDKQVSAGRSGTDRESS